MFTPLQLAGEFGTVFSLMHPAVPIKTLSRRRRRPGGSAEGAAGKPLPVFIAYADIPAARRALTAIGEVLARNREAPYRLQPMFWRFDQLEGPRWFQMALSDASQAGVIVIAMSSPTALHASAEAWLSALATRHRGGSIHVVTLFDEELWTVWLAQAPAAEGVPADKRKPAVLRALPGKSIAACAA